MSKTIKSDAAAEAMTFMPDLTVDARNLESSDPDCDSRHRHIAIEWAGGVLWLDMSVQSDHYCIDVRQFVPEVQESTAPPGVQLAGQGVFTIVNGRRQSLIERTIRGFSSDTDGLPLPDPDGTPVRGHGWNGGYVITLMHDKVPSERQTNRPAGPGRG